MRVRLCRDGQEIKLTSQAPPADPSPTVADTVPAQAHDGPATLCVEQFWREGGRFYAQGWAHAQSHPIRAMSLLTWAGPVAVTDWRDRPDLRAHVPSLPPGARTGFATFLPDHDDRMLRATIETDAGTYAPALLLPPAMPRDILHDWQEQTAAYEAGQEFARQVNERHLEVLEIGARMVGTSTTDSRLRYGGAKRFVGMDIHPGPTVDVVGDAHRLSEIVGRAAFDAILSVAVLEHLEMPWVVAAEMNRALRPGGLVFHSVPQAWPVHELPNDFWRFTAPAMGVLFGPAHGFEVISSGMHNRVRIYPQASEAVDTTLPLGEAYASTFVLARKVADIDSLGADAGDLAERSRRYPVRGA